MTCSIYKFFHKKLDKAPGPNFMCIELIIHVRAALNSSSSSSSSFEGHPLQVRHKQDWGRGFIRLQCRQKKSLHLYGKKNFTRKILISFLLIAPAKNIVSIKRLQLRHMLVFGYTLLHSHCSACFVLLYSWFNNRSIKLDNIFHFLKF